ncbi:MAG TPA: SpoIIE family protein phosphatase [Thermoanaerobaculia bacterium]|nr:SpoIIE family protein phosphatase [Thermoanaerobaculia bacterium]
MSRESWEELLALSQDEAGERQLLERLLDLWREAHGATVAALYLDKGDRLDLEAVSGPPELSPLTPLPVVLERDARPAGMEIVHLGGGRLLFYPPARPAEANPARTQQTAPEPLTLLLASALKNLRLRQELKEQQFQVNYRVVELESLYDVGLAVAATLDLERVSEEILLRAVSLLDARRGALYILEAGRYRLDRTFGGEAAPWFDAGEAAGEDLRAFLAGGESAPADLLPGARYLLGVPIDIDRSPRGLLCVGDKESRRGVGPFPPADRRTLALFANQAAIALENARLHLQALEKERLEREMDLAAEIQRQILPHGVPTVAGFELLGWNRPARQIGGDYYDIFPWKDGRVGLVVGDVSGKGMPAALMVSTLHSALHLLLDQTGFGPPLLDRLNRHVLESSAANKFITLLLAELDPASGELLYLNAGHNPALLVRRGTGGGEREGACAVEQLGSTGLPIGVLPGSRFQARTVTIEPGDLLCIYSDGITEAESPADEEFGSGRLLELLRENCDQPLAEILAAIQNATTQFSAGLPQGDDQTLILLRRNLDPPQVE